MNNNWEFDYSNLYNSTGATPGQGPAPEGTPEMHQPYGGPHQPKKHWGRRIGSGLLALVLCGAVGFGGGYVGSIVAGGSNPTVVYQAAPAADSSDADNLLSDGDLSISQIASKVGPTVVEVTTESVTTNPFFGQYVQDGAGSGVIISTDGYIITNNHVVSGASQVKVTLQDKTQYDAIVIGMDSKTDIAVLKIEGTDFTSAVIGDSDTLQVGETAVAVGNPLGTLGGTVTDGIISALDRDITINSETMNLLQTNAAVSPGNSGGGLFNERGELVGIVNAKSSGTDTEGLGFAIPINNAMSVAESLMTTGYVTGRPALGVMVIGITDAQTAMQYGVSQLGVYVQEVNKNSAAEQAGLQVGDLFVSIDGTVITATSDITGLLNEHEVGDALEIQVVRDKQMLTVSLTLQESVPTSTQAESEPTEG